MNGGDTHLNRITTRIGSARFDFARNHVTKGWPRWLFSDSTVAIIGIGNIGGRLAANFAAGGQDFLLAGREQLIAQYGERLARLCHGLNRAKQKKTSQAAPPAIFTPVRRR
jgi:phosphoglycerate dehydrogenase-like enzyme